MLEPPFWAVRVLLQWRPGVCLCRWPSVLASSTMRHSEVFLVPLLMLLDYFLTVGGSKLAARKYSQHFKFEHYEMNPFGRKPSPREVA